MATPLSPPGRFSPTPGPLARAILPGAPLAAVSRSPALAPVRATLASGKALAPGTAGGDNAAGQVELVTPKLVTQREAARRLGVSEQTLRRWRRKGVLKGVYKGLAGSCRTVRFDLEETLAGLREYRARV